MKLCGSNNIIRPLRIKSVFELTRLMVKFKASYVWESSISTSQNQWRKKMSLNGGAMKILRAKRMQNFRTTVVHPRCLQTTLIWL